MHSIRGVSLWYAPAATGSPICAAADNNTFSVNFYEDGDSNIVGLIVYDGDGNLLDAYGQLPVEVVQNERKELGYPPLKLTEFLSASAIGAES